MLQRTGNYPLAATRIQEGPWGKEARIAPVLEICVDDPASLRAAISGGADRIELCSALALGGLTPSEAMTAAAVKTKVPVHAMVRPRAGDFQYDESEIELIADEIRRLADLGVAGVVVGASNALGELDEPALARFREAAKDLAIVLHRVIDLTPDPVASACTAARLGYDHVLTSGGATRAFDGRSTIGRMVAETAGTLKIIAASGITPKIAAALVSETGVLEIHASASRPVDWGDERIKEFGFASGPRRITDEALVMALKQSIASAIV